MIKDIILEIYPMGEKYIKNCQEINKYQEVYNSVFEIKKENEGIKLKLDFNKSRLNLKGKIILLLLGKDEKDKDKLIKLASIKHNPLEIKKEIDQLKAEKILKENKGMIKVNLEKITNLWDLTSEDS
jgi:hypothetical protein